MTNIDNNTELGIERRIKIFDSEYQLERFLSHSRVVVCSVVYYSSTQIKLNYIIKERKVG